MVGGPWVISEQTWGIWWKTWEVSEQDNLGAKGFVQVFEKKFRVIILAEFLVMQHKKYLTSRHLLQTSTATFRIQFHFTSSVQSILRRERAKFTQTFRVSNDSWQKIFSSISSGSNIFMLLSSSISLLLLLGLVLLTSRIILLVFFSFQHQNQMMIIWR